MVDCKEWHEGLITHYHRSGKHCVEFRAVSEKRWFHMLKLAFYIIDPQVGDHHENNEFKDDECEGAEYTLHNSDRWTYYEDISFDYAFTQSVLFKVYGGVVQETGHKTRGHVSLTEYDRYCCTALLCTAAPPPDLDLRNILVYWKSHFLLCVSLIDHICLSV